MWLKNFVCIFFFLAEIDLWLHEAGSWILRGDDGNSLVCQSTDYVTLWCYHESRQVLIVILHLPNYMFLLRKYLLRSALYQRLNLTERPKFKLEVWTDPFYSCLDSFICKIRVWMGRWWISFQLMGNLHLNCHWYYSPWRPDAFS